jgi:heat shock protein HtpX
VNIYDQQRSNRRRTWLIVALFVAFLLILGAGFDSLYIGGLGGFVPIGSILALAVGSVGAMASYYTGDRAVLLSSGARPISEVAASASDADRPKLRQLDNVVDEMAIAAGIPRPPVYIVPDADPNAFATGRGPGHASIAVTRGLLDTLDREELQGVVAHEMSHIRNLDTRVMTIVAALVGAVALLADWSRRGMWFGGGRRRDNDRDGGGAAGAIFFVVWIVAMIVAPMTAQMLAMMVSRKREFLADASGAELTRNPNGLAQALEKIEAAVEPTRAIKQGSAHLCIADPLGRRLNVSGGERWSSIFASHPPMAQRIAALRQMAYQFGGDH